MKTILIMIIALFSQLTFGSPWKHINQKVHSYNVRISYTSDYLPATYGSEGGQVASLFFVDLYSGSPSRADSVELFEIKKDGRLSKVSEFRLTEDHSRHFYGKMPKGRTYGDQIWFKRSYKYRITVDGRVIEGNFKL